MADVVSLAAARGAQPGRRLIPERLSKARKAKRLFQSDLAELVGLTRQAISAFEQGEKHPDGETMFKIAAALDQPISYFVGEMPPLPGPIGTRFMRAFGVETKRRNEQCSVHSEWLVSGVSFLTNLVNFPAAVIPLQTPKDPKAGYDEEEIEEAAMSVRRAWGLGDGPIGHLIKLAESKGIFIARLPIEDDRVDAFSFWCGGKPFVMLGSNDVTAVRLRWDVAHEIGHLVLHRGVDEAELEDKKTLKRIEAEANRFAGALLLPRSTFPNEIFSTRLDAFKGLKERWKVAISAQVHRCSDLGLFTELQTLNLYKQISARRWRKWEPLDDELAHEKPTMLRRAVELLLQSGKITADHIASSININRKIIAELCAVDPGLFESPAPVHIGPVLK